MKIVFAIFMPWILLTTSFGFGERRIIRTSRIGLLRELVESETKLNALDVYRYGCWCGPTDADGKAVLDDFDFCCKVHDFCESDLYNKCGGRLLDIERGFKYNTSTKQCTPPSEYSRGYVGSAQCSHAVCLCDMEMVRCMKYNKDQMNPYNVGWRSEKSCKSGICFENSCYLFTSKGTTWSENREKCQGKGGDLVSMETEEEWGFINNEIEKRSAEPRNEWHIGLKKQEDGTWKWVNGRSLTISKWQVTMGQPSGDGDVTVMAKAYPSNTQGLFNDLEDGRPRAYICEIPKEDDSCKTKADVILLIQDSRGISQSTGVLIKRVVRRLLNLLGSDTTDYKFALGMYATTRKISYFGSKDDAITYMNAEYAKGKSGRNLGTDNILKSALEEMVRGTFNGRPTERRKILVIFSDGKAENNNGQLMDTFKLRETEQQLKVGDEIKVVGALIPNSDNTQRIQELKSITSEPDDAIEVNFGARGGNRKKQIKRTARRLAFRVRRLMSCQGSYTVVIYTPKRGLVSEFSIHIEINGRNAPFKTREILLREPAETNEGESVRFTFDAVDVGNITMVKIKSTRRYDGQTGWRLIKIKVIKGQETVIAQFNREIPAWQFEWITADASSESTTVGA